jgi:hypothetical protein
VVRAKALFAWLATIATTTRVPPRASTVPVSDGGQTVSITLNSGIQHAACKQRGRQIIDRRVRGLQHPQACIRRRDCPASEGDAAWGHLGLQTGRPRIARQVFHERAPIDCQVAAGNYGADINRRASSSLMGNLCMLLDQVLMQVPHLTALTIVDMLRVFTFEMTWT